MVANRFGALDQPWSSKTSLGDFDEVDGVARPGLAKLVVNGRLDERFRPLVKPEVITPTTLAPQHLREQYGDYWLNPRRSERILPLSNDGLIIKGDARWEVRDLDGKLNEAAFADRGKEGENRAEPLFDQDGRIFMRVSLEGRVRVQAYRSSDFRPDPSFHSISFPFRTLASGHLPPSGKFLISQCGYSGVPRQPRDGPYTNSRILRLFPDGRVDPSFQIEIPPTDQALRWHVVLRSATT